MIRKPSADWGRLDEGAAVRTIRTASAVADGGVQVARRGGHAMVGLISFMFAGLWGFVAIASGLSGNLPLFIGVGAMAAFALWRGTRAFAKARGPLD
jgi:hypothetical protein